MRFRGELNGSGSWPTGPGAGRRVPELADGSPGPGNFAWWSGTGAVLGRPQSCFAGTQGVEALWCGS